MCIRDSLESVSVVLLEQIRTIDKERLSDCLGKISVQDMQRVEAVSYTHLKRDTPARLIAFAISTMFLPAITEESFYRKSIISFRSKPALVLSAVFGMLLYAAEHSLKPWGIFLTAIWALSLIHI